MSESVFVTCQDGARRHGEPFPTMERAKQWAEWGHACLRGDSHTFRTCCDDLDAFMFRFRDHPTRTVIEVDLDQPRERSPWIVVSHAGRTIVLDLMALPDHTCVDVHSFVDGEEATAGVFGMSNGFRATLDTSKFPTEEQTTSHKWKSTKLVAVLVGEQGAGVCVMTGQYEYEIQGHYAHGWECVTTEATPEEARAQLACYRENEPGTRFRTLRVGVLPTTTTHTEESINMPTDNIHQYVLVRIGASPDEQPYDVERYVDNALRAASFFREDMRFTVREINRATYEAARAGNGTDDSVSVDDFVSVEDEGNGIGRVLVWTADGNHRVILRTGKAECSIAADIVKGALRTWDGWK